MHKCIVCGAALDEQPLMVCKNMPDRAQDLPDEAGLDYDKPIDIALYQCSGCGLVQLCCAPVSYYRDVIRTGGYNRTMQELRRFQYRHFIESFGLKGKKIIEVGCGQGEFLQTLTEFPVQAFGIEHKPELVAQAQAKGLRVTCAFTQSEDMVLPGGPFDAFLSFNFIEHQPDPNTMLRCIYNNLADDGCGLITAPSFEYILQNNAFYELLHDHIANYTENTLRFLLERNGFAVCESTIVNRDTLAMQVQKRPRVCVAGMQRNIAMLAAQLRQFVDRRKAEGRRVAVWGASHQAFTTLSSMGIGQDIRYIIDSAPFKQGKYAPASHVPIVAPEHFFEDPVECILIVAPGYTQEIASVIGERFGSRVEIAALRSAEVEIVRGGVMSNMVNLLVWQAVLFLTVRAITYDERHHR